MHKYLRAIGFTEQPKRKDIYNLIEEGISNAEERIYTSSDKEEDALLAQFNIQVGLGYGITVCGQFDEGDKFYPEYFYPYLESDLISSMEEVSVEKRIDSESFSGVCDDLHVGTTLIFRLRNSVEYLKRTGSPFNDASTVSCSLSALSMEGSVMLPLFKTDADKRKKRDTELKRRDLLVAARNGDENAVRDLTVSDMDTYANIMSHVQYEDIFTMIESYFMPYGAECELYSVMGEIKSVRFTKNHYTLESVIIITLDINGLFIDVAINQKDLLGDPQVGRRFKGVIWLQGKVNFAKGEDYPLLNTENE